MCKLINIQNFSIKYIGQDSLFNNICADIFSGEIYHLLGDSGQGKTTFLSYIQGINRDIVEITGDIKFDDGIKIRSSFQSGLLIPWLSVKENILFGLKSENNMNTIDFDQQDFNRLLTVSGLIKSKNKLARDLSGGMKQRVGFLRALITKPDLLLLDEPFSSLDKKNRTQMVDLLFEYQKKYKFAIIYTTHNDRELLDIKHKEIILCS